MVNANPNRATVALLQSFREYLSVNGHRVTNQRLAIFEAAVRQTDQFTAEGLFESARRIDESVSRATIYRSLPLLIEAGTVREVDIGKDYKYYVANRKADTFQAQVVCLDCDKIFEVDAPFMEWYGKTVSEKLDLAVETQRLQVTARCRQLERDGFCKRAERTVLPVG